MTGQSGTGWAFLSAEKKRQQHYRQQVEAELPSLLRFARGLVRHVEDAEDLVHDSCVKALKGLERAEFDNRASLRAWLKRILVNTYRDQYRRSQRSPVLPADYHAASGDGLNVYELVAGSEQSPLQRVQDRDSSSAIQQALSALPPEVRVVSVLFLVNEMSYRDIAFITECPIGTVMSRLSRGRRLLRESLAAHAPGDTENHATTVAGSDQP